MGPSSRLPLLALLLLTAGCDPLFYLEAETEEICRTEHNLTFPPALPGSASLQQGFAFPLGDLGTSLPDGTLESELRLHLFELTATSGNPDLSGIELATVSLRRPGETTPTRLIEYRRAANQPSTQQLSLTGNTSVDLLELAREEELDLIFEASGSLPRSAWTADFRACASLRLQVEYFDAVF